MGFMDFFRRKDNIKENEIQHQEEKTYDIRYAMHNNGNLQIDFKDNRIGLGQTYDTTRLVIGRNPMKLGNAYVANAKVSWYGSDDVVFIGMGETETSDAHKYTGIWAEINYDLLQRDEAYCVAVMSQLLNKNRVTKYIEDGLQDYPEQPCGKYVGGISVTRDGEYKADFSEYIGKMAHETPLMVNRRRENREKVIADAERRKIVAQKQAEIRRIQEEIDSLR